MALVVATAAAHAVEYVGLPGGPAQPGPGRRPPGHRAQVEPGGGRHLAGPGRRAARASAARCRPTCATPTTGRPHSLGHGVGYDYPHDDPRGWVHQQYLPDEARDAVYYRALPARLRAGDRRAHGPTGRRRRPATARDPERPVSDATERRTANRRRAVSATDLAAVIVAACSVVAVVLLAVAIAALVRTLRALREVADAAAHRDRARARRPAGHGRRRQLRDRAARPAGHHRRVGDRHGRLRLPARLHRHGQPGHQGRGLRQRHRQGGPPAAGPQGQRGKCQRQRWHGRRRCSHVLVHHRGDRRASAAPCGSAARCCARCAATPPSRSRPMSPPRSAGSAPTCGPR